MSAFEERSWLKHYAEWTPHTLDYGDTTLLSMYDDNLAAKRDKPATWFFGKVLSFGEIDEDVRSAAAGLRALGVRRGDHVAIALPNCPQHVAVLYAILKLGAVAVEHNPLYTAHELTEPFRDHGARVAVIWDKATPTFEKLRGTTELKTIVAVNMIEAMPKMKQLALRLPVPKLRKVRTTMTGPAPHTIPWSTLVSDRLGGSGSDIVSDPEVTKDDPAVIMYTSGTTGTPKGAQLTHGSLYANLLQGIAWVRGLGSQDEKMLAAVPPFHAYGLTMNYTLAFLIGGQLLLLPVPAMPLIMDVIRKNPPTWVPGVPTLYSKIVEAARAENVPLTSIRNSLSGASTLPVQTVKDWEDATGGLLIEGYGLTETSPIISGNPMTPERRPGYVGIPFPDTEIRIADPNDLDRTMPDGEEGEVLVRGPQLFKGYLNNEEATRASFHGDWYRTGDIGIMDEEGFICLVSRLKEIIITGGFNVYPTEVEEALREHPAIDDIAVVGEPREDGSESVVACVTFAEGAEIDPEALKEFARERLTRYKVPRRFYHFETLARDQMGKIRRRDVQADLLARLNEKNGDRAAAGAIGE